MLTQYCLLLEANRENILTAQSAYLLYAALLEHSSESFAEQVHANAATPVSQFLLPRDDGTLLWTVNLLGAESERFLCPVLDKLTRLTIRREGVRLNVNRREKSSIETVEGLLCLAGGCSGNLRMNFRTATAFKSKGQYVNLPTARLVVQNLLNSWNGCITDCPIEDEDGMGMEVLAQGLRFRDFSLQSSRYRLKNGVVPGFFGTITAENTLDGFQRQLLNALLLFAGYAGIGIKTTLGMGGVQVREE